MSKQEKKRITDLMDNSIPSEEMINQAAKQIHQPNKEKMVRATVDLPESFHKELRKLLIDMDKDLKAFCKEAIMDKYEQLNSKS